VLLLVIGSSEENFGHDQQQEKSKATTFKPFLVSLSRWGPIGGNWFDLELVNEGRCVRKTLETLLGGKPVKLSVAVEILARALSQRALEFFAR